MGVLKGVGIAIKGFGKALRGKGKVSPTIKSVKPNLTKTVKETKQDEYRKRYTALDKAEGKVKEGRKVYLTLNSIKPPKIKMPKLINGSVKNAQLILKTYDLFLGKINYVPDMAANAVIQQYHNGDIIHIALLFYGY